MSLMLDIIYLQYYTLAGIWLVLLYRSFRRWRSPLSKLPYPPGPPERSIIAGNAADIPGSSSWLTYIELGKKYGSVLHLRLYTQHTIVLNSYEDCIELLEKRSNIFSDRPTWAMEHLMGWGFDTVLLQYGPEWRAHRRLYSQAFKPETSLRYRPLQTKKVNHFLHGLLNTPEDFMGHYRTLPGAVIMSSMYDHDVSPKNDFFVDLAEAAVAGFSYTVLPGAALLNELPILRFIPSWLPGITFKRAALNARKLVLQMRDLPFASVEMKMKEGEMPNCVTAELLQNCKSKEERTRVGDMAGTSYSAGADTITSSLGTFFYAMAMFPEIQAKAKKDIDLIVGTERLVNFDDMSSLPYVEALRREIMRWRPVTPLGVMHAVHSDDVYKGYYIPKGAIVVYNTWAIAHDPMRYPDPDSFNPDRFFNESGELNNDEVTYVFGFGRRMCPGRHMASATMWLAMATVLQNFDIRKKQDSTGKEIPMSGKYSDGLLIHPLPFECSITPRSDEAAQIILDAVKRSY